AAHRGVSFIIVLTAHNHGFLDAIEASDYEYFLRETAKIGPVHNMMFYSPLTTDDCNYYEVNHFRPEAGSRIVKALSSDGAGDFARGVTEGNMDGEAHSARRNFDKPRRAR